MSEVLTCSRYTDHSTMFVRARDDQGEVRNTTTAPTFSQNNDLRRTIIAKMTSCHVLGFKDSAVPSRSHESSMTQEVTSPPNFSRKSSNIKSYGDVYGRSYSCLPNVFIANWIVSSNK